MQLINRVINFFKKMFAINDQITSETIAVKCQDLRNKAIEAISQTNVTVLDVLGAGYVDFYSAPPKVNDRCGQFLIRHKKTGLMYIGQTRRMGTTLPSIISNLRNNKSSNPYLREFAEEVTPFMSYKYFDVFYTLTPKFKDIDIIFNVFNEYNVFINVLRNGRFQYSFAERAYKKHTQSMNSDQLQLQ